MDTKAIKQALDDHAHALYGLCEKIITLASGLLAVTVTFRNSLLSTPGVRETWLLDVAWLALGLAVLFGLLMFYGRVLVHAESIRALARGESGVALSRGFYRHVFAFTFGSFTLALGAFVAFAILNTK